jgi:[ribosomal protein S5]-alanine N-acetyltransferase
VRYRAYMTDAPLLLDRPVLRGERVRLRAPQVRDMSDRLAYGRSAEFVRMVGGDARVLRPLTTEDVQCWYEALCADPLGWVIEAEGRCIGEARLHSADEANRRARYACGIFDPEMWGCGYGSDATQAVLAYAFTQLCLHRVDLRVLDFNSRAIASYEKCGFVREGVEREGALIADAWQTDVMMSILEQEYQDRR